MAVRKDDKGRWVADVYRDGKRLRRRFDSKAEANRFISAIKQENNPLFNNIQIQKEQPQRLSELITQWYDLHGKTLVGGRKRFEKLMWISRKLGDPLARHFTAEMFADFRAKRLSGEIVNDTSGKVPKESLINLEHSHLRAVFNELRRLGKWKGDNPLALVRKFKVKEKELCFLRTEEIDHLLVECDRSRNVYLKFIVRICLATGARWGEAEALLGSQVMPYRITFTNTKNGKNRTVPISQQLYDMLPLQQGRIFSGSYYKASLRAFKSALVRADIHLTEGQATHVLRHTFASHFMMNGGNILVLRDILGHSDIKMTMRYAHFAPSYLEQAVSLNPLENRV